MNRSAIVATAALCVLAAAGAGFWFGAQRAHGGPADTSVAMTQLKGASSSGGAPMAVEAAKVARQPLPQTITAVGSLRSDESVTLRPEVAGRVNEILFKEGQNVRQGMTLVRLDPAINAAEVQQAKANLTLAKSKYDRAVELAQRNFISGQAKDEAENNLRVAEAAVALVEARLAKTEIRAPFSGVIGLRVVSVGDYVKEGADMVNLESIDPLKVDFRVPETYMRQVQPGQTLTVTLDALPGRKFDGKVLAVNPLIDAAGRSVVIRAVVRNADTSLRPGMFTRVNLITKDEKDALVIPEQAIVPQGDEQFVFRIVDGKVVRVKVDIGQRRDGKVEVLKGLDVNDMVVTAGQLKLRDGMPVTISTAPGPASAAVPAVRNKDGSSELLAARKLGRFTAMLLPEICIKRPVFATVLSLIILLIGLISYTRLSVREYPRIDEPVVSVNVTYRGASAEVVESQVTKPLEDSLAGIEGVELMTSQSRSETSRINVRFTLKRDPDSAAADVRDKVSRARGKLPDTIDEPIISKVEADSQPVIYIAVEAGSLSALDASDYVKRYVQPRLSVLPGAADVRIFGERQVSMRINLDRTRLAGYKLTVQDVEEAIRRQNAEIPAGRIESSAREFTVVAETDVRSPEQFNSIIVANVGGYPVRVRDVGNAEIGPVDERTISRFNGKPSLNIGVIKQAVSNPLELSNAVRDEVKKINDGLPTGMKLVVAYDTSVFIDRSISSVFETILEAIVLVVLVIFFFLRSLRATIIPIVTIPVSLIGAFGIMYMFGFTINTLTLLSMVLAIGLVVDDAIVMLENIFRHIEDGMPRREGSIVGAREIGFAIVAMTLTLTSVFAPLAFATGRTGRLFIEFALTLAGAVLVSGFIALTLSPMMCSLLLKHEEKHSWIFNLVEGWLQALTNGYRAALSALLHARWVVMVVWVVTLVAGAVLFMSLKSELAPIEDRGVVFGVVTAPQGSTPQYTADQIKPIEEFYAQIPEAAAWTAISGFPTVVDGNAVLRLKPWEERKKRQQQIADEMRPKFASVPGAIAFPLNPPSLGQSFRSTPIEFVIMSQIPYGDLQRLVDRFLDEARKYPGVQNLQTDLRLNTPEVRVRINRDKLSDIGVPVDTVGRTLETMLGGRQVTRFKREGEQYDVIVQVAPVDRTTPADISDSYVRARDGSMVQLSNLVDVKEGVAPQSLNHFNRLRAVKVTATLVPGYAIDEALRAMEAAAKATLPATAQTDVDGQSREFRKSGKEIYFTFVLALAFIYLVLSAQFESFVHPFVIMLSVPLSMTGALFMLWITGGTLNIYSQVGLVTLVGLITKHGILIVEFSNQLRAKGEKLMDAVIDAATLRLRPILMTTGAMVLGAVPLALAHGAGAESRTQIGWVIVGGMSFGTLLTLFVVPTAYTLLAGRSVHREAATPAAPAGPLHGAPASGHAD